VAVPPGTLRQRPRRHGVGDIAAAWAVVEKVSMRLHPLFGLRGEVAGWRAAVIHRGDTIEKVRPAATAETAPLAICRAALLEVTRNGEG
jgi:hypothetical protein